MIIQKFEDIIAWQKARELTKIIYKFTNTHKEFQKDFSLKDQIRRASVSVMSNIAEGFMRQTNKEFIQFLFIASGSNAEVQSQLYIALDLSYISEEEFKNTLFLSSEIGKMLTKFIQYLQKN